jgi:heptosyltransferase-2
MPNILIIKLGAAGDIVRTAYLAPALKRKFGRDLRLSWLTSPVGRDLLVANPAVDDTWTSVGESQGRHFDAVFSLEEDEAMAALAVSLDTAKVSGVLPSGSGQLRYTDDCAAWFDMSLISRFGRDAADRLKKENRRSFLDIFGPIFGVSDAKPEFYGNARFEERARRDRAESATMIGVSPFAGLRWPSKSLSIAVLGELLEEMLRLAPASVTIALLGRGEDRLRNLELAARFGSPRICVPDTESSVLAFAALIKSLDYLITADSLAMHLANSQSVPFLAFFAPTSAAEVENHGYGVKLLSTAPDYCSYRPDADNRSITARRILDLAGEHAPFRRAMGLRSPP